MQRGKGTRTAYNDTVLANFDMVPNGGCFDDRVGAYMNMIAYFHGIVVECAAIGLVWRSSRAL